MDSLIDLVDLAAEKFGDQTFACDGVTGDTLSFAGLRDASERVAAALTDRCAIRPGQHVAILMPNTIAFLPVYFGILRAGARAVPINARLKSEEFEYILHNCEARVLFVHPRTWEAASGALGGEGGPGHVIGLEFTKENLPKDVIDFQAFTSGDFPDLARPTLSPEDVALIIYTSGTTGRPKGAMLTHGNVLFNISATKAGHGTLPTDVHLLSVPLFHVTGLNTILPTALEQGAQIVVSRETDPEELLEIVARFGCTTFIGVPTTFYLLTQIAKWPVSLEALKALRLICYSGAPMAASTISAVRDRFPGVRLHNFFGLTETTSVSSVLPDEQALKRAESVGLPPPGIEFQIFNEEGEALPCEEIGELVIRGPSVFKAYFKRDEETAEALKGGWFHTGDTAYLDSEGYLFLQGRKKELIIVGGENVYPMEVENALCRHPDVQEAAVYGLSNNIFGELVYAAVVLQKDRGVDARELRRFLMDKIAPFKMPRKIRVLEQLPRNPSGKVMKRELITMDDDR